MDGLPISLNWPGLSAAAAGGSTSFQHVTFTAIIRDLEREIAALRTSDAGSPATLRDTGHLPSSAAQS